jgi:hypothetical protein
MHLLAGCNLFQITNSINHSVSYFLQTMEYLIQTNANHNSPLAEAAICMMELEL